MTARYKRLAPFQPDMCARRKDTHKQAIKKKKHVSLRMCMIPRVLLSACVALFMYACLYLCVYVFVCFCVCMHFRVCVCVYMCASAVAGTCIYLRVW